MHHVSSIRRKTNGLLRVVCALAVFGSWGAEAVEPVTVTVGTQSMGGVHPLNKNYVEAQLGRAESV